MSSVKLEILAKFAAGIPDFCQNILGRGLNLEEDPRFSPIFSWAREVARRIEESSVIITNNCAYEIMDHFGHFSSYGYSPVKEVEVPPDTLNLLLEFAHVAGNIQRASHGMLMDGIVASGSTIEKSIKGSKGVVGQVDAEGLNEALARFDRERTHRLYGYRPE